MGAVIAIDAMGGDRGAGEVIPAVLDVHKRFPDSKFVLVGHEEDLCTELRNHSVVPDERLRICHAEEVIGMGDSVINALRKKRSSMRVALELLRNNDEVKACVSAGNTGALVANSRSALSMLPGIDAPAICAVLPGLKGETLMLDLGAIVDTRVEQLLQFAVMGAELAVILKNKEAPSVGLLNVGHEEIKGNSQVREAARLLQGSTLNYVGYVEGTDLYSGETDVIVCDGFVGNVALKTSEGVADLLKQKLIQGCNSSLYSRLIAWLAIPMMTKLSQELDTRHYNGATLLGLKSIVVKSHGGADRVAFAAAIRRAMLEVEYDLPAHISERLSMYDWMWQ